MLGLVEVHVVFVVDEFGEFGEFEFESEFLLLQKMYL